MNWLQICTHIVKNNDMTVALLKTQMLSSNNNRFWWDWYIRFSINYTTGKIASSWQLLHSANVKINRVKQLPGYLLWLQKAFSSASKPLPLSYFLVNPCSSCQYLKACTITRLAFFPFCTTLILVDICTLCAVLSQVED